jgi:hypothetical protein
MVQIGGSDEDNCGRVMLPVEGEEISSSCKTRLRVVEKGEIACIKLIAIQPGIQKSGSTSHGEDNSTDNLRVLLFADKSLDGTESSIRS